ncbi:hypothetical protein [Rhodococcus daqingensis]|uniref:Terminase n=1 Tax=Rhodococcus daqingensis TaxID=2479363 RepID=A0ABW2S305_9NOCA
MVSTICDDFPTLTGRQEPHNLSVFAGDVTHAKKAVELGRRAGSIAMPWQTDAQHAILSTTPSGRWTHPTCCLIVPRQNGKSEILIQRCLYGLFKLGETIIYTAQRWKTARDAWKRMMALIKGRPWLKKRVVKSNCSQGEGIIELASGAVISFGTRSNDTGRGLTDVDLIVYDEAYNLTDGEVSAMAFVQMAAKNPQRIYASSAVNQDQHSNGEVLASVRERGLAQEPNLYFAEFLAPEGMSRDDEETWRYANPSYGVIQTAEKILDIMVNLSTPAGRKGFDVEALGRGDWPVIKTKVELYSVIKQDHWEGTTDTAPQLIGPIGIGIDRTMDRKWWIVAAAQRTTAGRIHVEIGYYRSASQSEFLDYTVDLVTLWDPCALAINKKSPANVLEAPLIDALIEPAMTSAPQMVTACGDFLDATVDGSLSHTGQPILTEAVAGAVKRTLPAGDWAWSVHDNLAALIAATLARWALVTFGAAAITTPAAAPVAGTRDQQDYDDSFDALTAAF